MKKLLLLFALVAFKLSAQQAPDFHAKWKLESKKISDCEYDLLFKVVIDDDWRSCERRSCAPSKSCFVIGTRWRHQNKRASQQRRRSCNAHLVQRLRDREGQRHDRRNPRHRHHSASPSSCLARGSTSFAGQRASLAGKLVDGRAKHDHDE